MADHIEQEAFARKRTELRHCPAAIRLLPTLRKPFDVFAEGLLVKNNRGDWQWRFPNDVSGEAWLRRVVTRRATFDAERFRRLAGG